MLVTTMTIIMILTGGGAGNHVSVLQMLEEFNALILEHVVEESRAGEATQIVEDMSSRLVDLGEQVLSRRQEMIALDRDHDATREEFAAAFARVNEAWDEAEILLIEGQIQLREKITEDEWNAIYDELRKKRN